MAGDGEVQCQTASLYQASSNCARFGYTMKGEPSSPPTTQSPRHMSTKTVPSLLLAVSLNRLSHLLGSITVSKGSVNNTVLNAVWTDGWILVSFHTWLWSLEEVPLLLVTRCSDNQFSSQWLQRFIIISGDINTVNNCNRRAWYNMSCVLQAYCYVDRGQNFQLAYTLGESWCSWRNLWGNQKWQWWKEDFWKPPCGVWYRACWYDPSNSTVCCRELDGVVVHDHFCKRDVRQGCIMVPIDRNGLRNTQQCLTQFHLSCAGNQTQSYQIPSWVLLIGME